MKKIVMIAGGTGGHIFPGIVVAQACQAQGHVVAWMGVPTGMEKKTGAYRYAFFADYRISTA